ncbi:MAG: hypothetical protein IJG82_09590 [Atopobiaceae bacterium]|nr:hypothetical protein [Atopobiaceae bacterium]MBQ9042560.1 hypothetical protein [Eggerthellaceae bacterium]
MTTHELTREQMRRLKQDYICFVRNAGKGTTWGELADAEALVDDDEIHRHYAGQEFTYADFA